MRKFVYVFDEETKKTMLNKGFELLKDSKPFIFKNNKEIVELDAKNIAFSDVMQF